MSDDNLKLGIELDVAARGADVVDQLRAKLRALDATVRSINAGLRQAARSADPTGRGSGGTTRAIDPAGQAREAMRDLKSRFTFESRMAAQRVREQRAETREFIARMREQRRAETESLRAVRVQAQEQARSFRERMLFGTRMIRQQARDEAALDRDRQRSARETIRLENYRFGLREREERRLHREGLRQDRERASLRSSARQNARDALSSGRDSYQRLTRTGAGAALAGTAASAALARRALIAEADIDSAEINARIYGGLSKDTARQLRDQWAAPLAEQLGVSTAKLLTSYTDALKVGVSAEAAKQFSALATQTSEAWGVPFEGVVDTLGTVNSILTSTGEAFSFERLKSVANSLQYLAAKQSTTPEKLISFLQRGAGASQVLGMSQEAGLAFGSASTSLGNQASESGRLFDYLAGRLVKMPDMVKKHGLEGTRAKELIRNLGYGSFSEMDRRRRASPDEFLPDFMERFAKIKDTKKQEQLIQFFAGQEWLGEFGRMVKGIATYREAANLAKEAKGLDAIGEVWKLHSLKLAFVFKQIKAGFLNILGEFGKVLSPMARQVGDFFLDWSRKLQGGGLQARFRAAIDGLIQGFGFRDLPDLLRGVFGAPGQGDAGAISQWRSTARAFAEGITDTIAALKRLIAVFTGGDRSSEAIARWTGRLVTFAAACVIAAPAVAVLGGLASGITALGFAALGAWRILKAAGLIGATGPGAAPNMPKGPGAGAGGLLGRLLGRFGIGGAAAFAGSSSLSKGEQDALTGRLYQWAEEQEKARGGAPTRAWTDPPLKKSLDGLKESVDENARLLKQNAEGDWRGLIHKGSYATSQPAQAVKASLSDGASALRNSVMSGAIGASTGGFSSGPLASSIPGSALGGGSGLSRRGILGGGSGGGVGASDSSPIAPFKGSQSFDGLAPRIMADLRKDFGVTREQAAGMLGNLGHESGGFRHYQELRPLGGGRGGAGWAQWTGSRRRAFEAYARERGLDTRSYEAQYGFLRHELQTTHKGAITAVKRQSTAQGAMVAFENQFERAGVKAWASRQKWTNRALGLPEGVAGVTGPGPDLAKQEALKSSGWTKELGGNAAAGFTSSGWKPGLGGNTPLGRDTPIRPQNTMPIGGGAGAGASSSTHSVSAPITIHGGNGDPEAIANAVQRKLSEAMNRRTHDISPSLA